VKTDQTNSIVQFIINLNLGPLRPFSMKITIIFLSLVLPSTLFSQSNQIYNLQDFHALSDSVFLLLHNEDHSNLASLYDKSSNTITREFVSRGRGPGEIENLGAFIVDNNNESIFLSDFNSSRLTQYDINGLLINEKVMPTQYITSLSYYNETLISSNSFFAFPSEIDNKKVLISYLIDVTDFSITDSLFFNIKELPLEQIKGIEKLQFLKLSPKVVQIASDLFFLVFEQINYVFLIDRESNILDKVVIDIPNYEMIKTVTHPEYGTGTRTRDIFNDFSQFKDGVLFTYGDQSLGVPFGVLNLTANKDKIVSQIYPLKNQKELGTEKFSITQFDNKIWGFDGSKFIELTF
tara:strand:- start:701 stop:1750 length:1050 start_codon:yes stop_codon:yes gene_type:complete